MDYEKQIEWHEPVPHAITNESIPSILNGMDVREGDEVVAIGGSGDQAFAIAERASRVTAVDMRGLQMDYMRWRVGRLREGDTYRFLRVQKHFREVDDHKRVN